MLYPGVRLSVNEIDHDTYLVPDLNPSRWTAPAAVVTSSRVRAEVEWYCGYYLGAAGFLSDEYLAQIERTFREMNGINPDESQLALRTIYHLEGLVDCDDASWLMETMNTWYQNILPPHCCPVAGLLRTVRALRDIVEALGYFPRHGCVEATLDKLEVDGPRSMSINSLVRCIIRDAKRTRSRRAELIRMAAAA